MTRIIIWLIAILIVVGGSVFGALLLFCDDGWCAFFDWQKERAIKTFEQCAANGYPVQESQPRVCRLSSGKTLTEHPFENYIKKKFIDPKIPCQNLCGDGECQTVVCQALGCPCAESVQSCPDDCVK